MTAHVLFVDDNIDLLRGIQRQLRKEQFTVLTVTSGEAALALLTAGEVDVLVVDERMPGMRGSELLRQVSEKHPGVVSIMLTGNPSLDLTTVLLNRQAVFKFLAKPYRLDELRNAIHEALEKRSVGKLCEKVIEGFEERSGELRRLEREFPGISKVRRERGGAVVLNNAGEEDVHELIKVLELYTEKKGEA